ncbi:hypothetical protein Goari_011537, partial [Gossypium aridum]|nr:hypothetical protein [Gossypium aridum]
MVFFSPNTSMNQCELYGDLLRMRVVDNLDNYLRLPLSIGKKKSMAFHLNRFSYRINSWSKRLLFYGEKERGWAILVWEKVRLLKGMGELGFRDLYLFNLALIGQQVCRLLTFKDTMCYHVLSSKHFPNDDLSHPKKVDKPSCTWTSIAIVAKSLENGFSWQVGDGNNIDICKDKWGFEGLNGDSLHCTTLNLYERKVQNLWLNNHLSWNKDRVHRLYGCFAGDCICNLPTLFNGSNDSMSFKSDCPRCGASVETLIHPLKDCPTARATLTIGGLNGRLLDKDHLCCTNWIEDVMHLLDKKAVIDFITMLWHSWSNRNNYVFRGNEDEAQIVKLNFDATISKNKIGFGVIVRDFDGLVLSRGWGFKDEDMMVDWEKLYALEESLKITRSLNIHNAIFETDCASLANRVKKGGEDIIIIGYHIKEILKTMEMCNNVAVNWTNRSCIRLPTSYANMPLLMIVLWFS